MNIPLANYQEPRSSIDALFHAACDKHIVLLRGQSGSGKSSLVDYCLDQVPDSMLPLHFDFKSSALSVPEILDQTSERLGRTALPTFQRQFAEYSAIPIEVRENRQQGWGNQINVDVRQFALPDRDQQRTLLTRAWFDDMNRLQPQLLLAFDTFEKASTDVRDWFGSAFLLRVARCPHLRIVVAGQEVPGINQRDLRRCSLQHDLYGVEKAKDWLPVVAALGLRLTGLDPLSVLTGLCLAYNGNPGEIMKKLQEIKRRESQ